MPGEGHLAPRREDAQGRRALRRRGWQEEHRLREIHLPRDLLHALIVEPTPIEKYRERIPPKHPIREYIHLHESIRTCRHGAHPTPPALHHLLSPLCSLTITPPHPALSPSGGEGKPREARRPREQADGGRYGRKRSTTKPSPQGGEGRVRGGVTTRSGLL